MLDEYGETVPTSVLNIELSDSDKVAQIESNIQCNDNRDKQQMKDTDEYVSNQAMLSTIKDVGDDVVD